MSALPGHSATPAVATARPARGVTAAAAPGTVEPARAGLPVRALRALTRPLADALVEIGARLGFANYGRYTVHGPVERLHFPRGGARRTGRAYCNTFFNTRSGHIWIGEGALISFNCMVLTGRHEFAEGRLRDARQVPEEGHDIHIGAGCWIASGAVITGGVTIGDHAIVAAGAVVTGDVPAGAMVAGVPARVVRDS